MIALRAGCLVVSVDYRLGAGAQVSGGSRRCAGGVPLGARQCARARRQSERGRGRRRFGGRRILSAVIAQELKRANEKPPVLQMLIYPVVDWLSETPSMKAFGDAYPLTTPIMDYFRNHYFANAGDEAKDLRASPGLRRRFERLAAGADLHGGA